MPPSIVIVDYALTDLFTTVFSEEHVIRWDAVDGALSDFKLSNLTRFTIWTEFLDVVERGEVHAIFKRCLPQSYRRGILWWGSREDDTGMCYIDGPSFFFNSQVPVTAVQISEHGNFHGVSHNWYEPYRWYHHPLP